MSAPSTKIAIVGMSGRFPGAPDVASFWRALLDGRELIRHFTAEELLESGVDRATLESPHYVRARPILDDVRGFDAEFFGMASRESDVTDPQLRLLLQCAWEALEESGHAPPAYDGTVGVYAGLRLSRYLEEHLLANPSIVDAMGRDYLMMVNRKDSAATWLAYRLDLTGPAISVNTACSTSLVAVHLAATALLNFECDVAVAGAAAIPCFDPEGYVALPDGPWSPDGHCRAFDQRAGGTLEGAGCAAVALKRLDDALAAGDVIHAILLGSAVNNDGGRKVGYSAPGLDGQARVIAEAMAVANVTGDDIGHVETHGTATPLGDPIEIAALTAAYRQTTSRVADCPVTSVKSNVGHLGVAAGMAGLIKAALTVERGVIPPSLHYEVPNPAIDFRHSPFHVNTTVRKWPDGVRRRAAVSSFGIGGTNAHIVMEEPPPRPAAASPRRYFLLPVSARTAEATAASLRRLADHLEEHPDLPLSCVSTTLRGARNAFECRRAVVAADSRSAVVRLRAASETHLESRQAATLKIGLRFGAGGLRAAVTAHLDSYEPAFRDALDRCKSLFTGRDSADLDFFAGQWALAEMLDGFGVRATSFSGAGVGELVAATRAGDVDLATAVDLAARGCFTAGSGPARVLESHVVDICALAVDSEDRGRDPVDGDEALLSVLARLWEAGAVVDWQAFGRCETTYRVSLPSYPFASDRHWIDRSQHSVPDSVVVVQTPPSPIPDDVLMLQPPRHEANGERLQRLVAAAHAAGYARIMLVDPAHQATPAPLAGAVHSTVADRIRDIWEKTLGVTGIAPDENFFDLGGDSLVAIQMISTINAELGVSVRPVELISSPTVSALAERVEDALLAGLDDATLQSMLAGSGS